MLYLNKTGMTLTIEKRINTLLILGFIVLMFSVPIFLHAQANVNTPPVVTPDTQAPAGSLVWICTGPNTPPGECTFTDLIEAVKRIVNWGTIFAISFSVIVIAYAGALYLISGENAGRRKEANTMLLKVAKGLAFIILAWLIVTLITSGLLVNVPSFFKP